jgi:hypothetical protein
MMPKKRTSSDFDQYLRERLVEATIMEILPGLEYGAVVASAVFYSINMAISKFHCADYDDPERKHDLGKDDPAFIETRNEGPGYPEIFIRINHLMGLMTFLQSQGNFEKKVSREEVIEWLITVGRKPYPWTGVSPRRLRSTYPIPFYLYEKWRQGDDSTEEEVVKAGT